MAVQVRNDELVDLLAPDFLRRIDEIINARIIRALTAAGLRLEDDAGNLGITIVDGGGVSIGSDSILALADGTARAQIRDTVGALLSLVRINSNAFGGSIELAKLKTAAYGVVADGDRLGAIGFSGSDGTDSAWAALIAAEVDGTPGNDDMPGRLIFFTTPDGSATLAEAARINNAGNLVMADGKNVQADTMRARDSDGLSLQDDGGNTALHIEDGGVTASRAGTSTGTQARVGGVLFSGFASNGNVGTGEDTIAFYNIPANVLATDGDSIWFEAAGTIANNANGKVVRARFGAAGVNLVLAESLPTSVGQGWAIRGRVVRTGATAQRGYAFCVSRGVTESDTVTSLNQTLSGAITIQITGAGTANDDIVCTQFIVGWDSNNT